MAIYKQIEQEDLQTRKVSSVTTDQKDKMEAIVTAFITHLKAAL
jgi:hypothetical protein